MSLYLRGEKGSAQGSFIGLGPTVELVSGRLSGRFGTGTFDSTFAYNGIR